MLFRPPSHPAATLKIIMCPATIRWESPTTRLGVENEKSKFQFSTFPQNEESKFQNFRISELHGSAQRRGAKHPEHSRAREGKTLRAPIARPPDVGMAYRHVRGIMCPEMIRMGVAHSPVLVWKTKCQSFRISEFQSFRISEFQNFRISEFHGCRRSGGARNIQSTREREKVKSAERAHRAASGCRDGASARSRHHVPRNDPDGSRPLTRLGVENEMSKFQNFNFRVSEFRTPFGILTGVGAAEGLETSRALESARR